jgi:hypothetical protein
MKATIFCRTTDKGVHTFYARVNGRNYYLFRQDYRRGVNEYFHAGVMVNKALNFGRSKNDTAIQKTMTKLPTYIKYVEKEYGISILDKTQKKNVRTHKKVFDVA